MADLEIQKGEFKVVGVAHTAAERWLSCKRLFVGGSRDMLPQENFSILKQFWSILRHIFSATEPDSPHFHEQTSTT